MEHGKTYKEIAEIMELSASNVGFILHNTMRKLRNEFRSAGGETK
jgi:DNA-directed RNA polymerase specialized sigma24 family protein